MAVRASVRQLSGLSGHADREGLADWLHSFSRKPGFVFVNHGDDAVAQHWAKQLQEEGYAAEAPYNGGVYLLAGGHAASCETGNTRRLVMSAAQPAPRSSAAYERLISMGRRLMAIIERSRGGANKDLAKFADQIAALCDKWER